jgi:hypothetical protein
MDTDELGRPLITDSIKEKINEAFKTIPPDGKAALVVISDLSGTRAQFAANTSKGWKVAAGAGFTYHEPKPYGYVAIEKVWR